MTSTLDPASLTRRLLRTPGVSLAAAIVLAGVALVVISIAIAVDMRGLDTAGLELDGAEVTRADARWPEVAPGDRLVAVDDVRISATYVEMFLAEAPLTGPATITLRRGEHELRLPVRALPLPPLHAVALAGRILAGAMCVILGALCFLLRPGARASWLFLAFTFWLAMMLLVLVAASRHLTLRPHLLHASFALSSSLGLHLLGYELPSRRRRDHRPAVIAAIYLPAVVVIVTGLRLDPVRAADHWQWGSLWAMVACAIGTVRLSRGWYTTRRRDRALAVQYRTMLVGLAIGLWLPLIVFVTHALPNAKWVTHLNAVPVLFYPAMMTTAVLRYNTLGADRLAASLVNYLLAIGAIVVACVLGLIAVPLLFERNLASSPLLRVPMTALVALGMARVYRALRRSLDRRFLRAQLGVEESRRALSELTRLVSAGDSAAALAAAHGALQVLHPEHVELWRLTPTGDAYQRQDDWGEPGPHRSPLPRDGALGAAVRVDRVWGVGVCTATAMPPAAQAALSELNLAVVAPIHMHGVVSGFVGLGVRRSALAYDETEQAYLATVAAQIGIALERQHSAGSVGAYRVERRLGVGGNAEVHLAWQIGPGGFERRVALKRPLPRVAEDAEHVALFLHEARVAASLRHPNIAQIVEVGRHQGGYFIAMEYVDGQPLRTLLARGHAMPVPIMLAVIVPLLTALDHAHRATDVHGQWLGLVHRDITPSNVLISSGGEVKVVDFGIARSTARVDVTRTGLVRGTPAYMSPEQARAQPLDARSDLYSVGVLLLECLGANLPPAVAEVAARARALDPDARFATAADMSAALLAACSPLRPAPELDLAAWCAAAAAPLGVEVLATVTSSAADTDVP